MRVIYKYALDDDRYPTVEIPVPHKILHVGLDRNSVECVWALVDSKMAAQHVKYTVHGTGDVCAHNDSDFIGTWMDDGSVFHLFRRQIEEEARG